MSYVETAPKADYGVTVHGAFRHDTYKTPCCNKFPYQLPLNEPMTTDISLVTCGGGR